MPINRQDDVRNVIVNPYSTVQFAERIFHGENPSITHDDWVAMQAELITEVGAKTWLEQLLISFISDTELTGKYVWINPSEAIVINPELSLEHEPLIDSDSWIEANAKLMHELGIAEWLWELLNLLEYHD